MSKREITILCLKLMGILSFLFAISTINVVIFTIHSMLTENQSSILTVVVTFIPTIAFILSGLYLFRSSHKISEIIFPESERDTASSKFSSTDIQTLAFSIIGLFILVQAIPSFFRFLSEAIFTFRNTQYSSLHYKLIGDFSELFIKFILGFYLFLQSEGLAKLWQRIKETRGMNTEE